VALLVALGFAFCCLRVRTGAQGKVLCAMWNTKILRGFSSLRCFVPSGAYFAERSQERILSPVRLPVSPPGLKAEQL